MGRLKDTILRSTINDYFENGPDARITAWVYPRATKTLPLWQNATPIANLPSSNFEIAISNTPTSQVLQPIVHMNVYPWVDVKID